MPTVLTVLVAVPCAAQATASITGRVVDGVSGKPVSAAVVSIGGPALVGVAPAAQPPRVLTGRDGRFAFTHLAPGTFTITASKGGYAEGEPGRRRPGGPAPPLVLSATDPLADVVVPMWRYSALAGTVVDEAGEPLVGLEVRALARATPRHWFSVPATTFTDDRGAYRFGSLLPGEYLVVASTAPISVSASVFAGAGGGRASGLIGAFGDSRALTPGANVGDAVLMTGRGIAVAAPPVGHRVQLYPPTFYPSALAPAQASRIALGPGEERNGVDLQIVPVATARVSGLLLNGGSPVPMTQLRLLPASGEAIPANVIAPGSMTDSAGNFNFAAVAPGRYTLRGVSAAGNGPAWADTPVLVADDDVDGLVVVMRPALRVTGRSRFEGNAPPPVLGSRAFTAAPFALEAADPPGSDGVSVAAHFGEHGDFTLIGYLPGRYRVSVDSAPAGWTFKAAMLNGVDVSETPFDLTKDVADLTLVFTDRPSSVIGVVDPAGAAASVLLFPGETLAWSEAGPNSRRFRAARANARGEFDIRGVPAGDYLVVAIADDPAADWRDPSMLEMLARLATQVSIGDGEIARVTLQVKDAR